MPLARRLPLLSLMVALATASATAWADPPGRRDEPMTDRGGQPRAERREHDHRALSDAVRRAERATRGQVLSAERVQFDGRDVNRVKIVDDRGRVRVYWDDPEAQRRQAPRTRDDDGDDPTL